MPARAKPQKAPDSADIPDVERHDEVYFRHRSGPKVGRVLARGAHGCTIESDGGRHKVRWDGFLGHKVRVRSDAKVVDQGEDGLLVEAPSGHRRFVRDPMGVIDAGGDVHKSLLPAVLFIASPADLMKAMGGGIKGRPGLTLQDTTDKGGKRTKRWKRAGGEKPKVDRHAVADGHHVKFKRGEHAGEGHIDGDPGEHGVHVRDGAGKHHQVLYSEVTHHDPKPKGKAKASASSPGFFATEAVAKLPAVSAQPAATLEELQAAAPEALEQFSAALGVVAKSLGLRTDVANPRALSPEDLSSADGFLFIGKLKSPDRAKQKVEADYGGDWSQLRDLVRATITVSTVDDVRAAVEAVQGAGLDLAQKPKDRFTKPKKEGYRDLLTVVRLPGGMLAELQFHLKPITVAKAAAHKDYEAVRSLEAKYGEDEPTDLWSPEDHKSFYGAMKRQRETYDAAWAAASKMADAG